VKKLNFIFLFFTLTLCALCREEQRVLPPLPPDPELNLWLMSEFGALYPKQHLSLPGLGKSATRTQAAEASVPVLYQYHDQNHSFYLKMAQRGYGEVMLLLAANYQFGRGVKRDLFKALRWYRNSAKSGTERGALATAVFYLRGYATPRNSSKALKWLRTVLGPKEPAILALAAEETQKPQEKAPREKTPDFRTWVESELLEGERKGLPGAILELGRRWINAASTRSRGFEKLVLLARRGFGPATLTLADLYYQGRIVPRDVKRAILFYQSLSDRDSPEALLRLSAIYQQGTETQRDMGHSLNLLSKAASLGSTQAAFLLGNSYLEGQHGQKQSRELASRWFKEAAQKNHLGSQLALGMIFLRSHQFQAALHWFEKAADQGHRLAQWICASLYISGLDTEKNLNRAAYWCALAAYQGHREAQFQLGVLYSQGAGLKQDGVLAFKWTLLAAQKGHVEAQWNLGVFYSQGRGVPKSLEKAKHWYHEAAEQNHVNAQVLLGLHHYQAPGSEKNFDQALHWLTQAAIQGDLEIQLLLAKLYAGEKEMPPDLVKAYAWYNVLETSDGKSRPQKLALAQRLGTDEIREAQGLAQQYWAQILAKK